MQHSRFDSKDSKEDILAEIRQGLAAVNQYAEQHGSFAELVREHYARVDAVDGDQHDPASR